MYNIKISRCLFYLFFLSLVKTEQLLPEDIGQVDYIEVVPLDHQNFKFSYYKYIDESQDYQIVSEQSLEACKELKQQQKKIRYQLNDDSQQIILEGEKQFNNEQFLIKIPLINVIKKNLFLKPFCSENQIQLYIYNFDHSRDENVRVIKMIRVTNKFKKKYFSGYQYNLLNVNLNTGDVQQLPNLDNNILCKPAVDFQFKNSFKFEFFMIEGSGQLTSRIKRDVNPDIDLNLIPTFINSFENLLPHCFLFQSNNNYKIVLRNQKSKKQGKEHEDHSLFQMELKTEQNKVQGSIFMIDDENRAQRISQCELDVDFLNQYTTIELKYIVLKAKNLYTEFSEIERESNNNISDSVFVGTQYYKNFDPEKYDCKIHFNKKETENKAFGFLFYKEIYIDIDEHVQDEINKQKEKTNYDDLLKKVNNHIRQTLVEQADIEQIIDEEQTKLSDIGAFNDLMDEFSEQQESENESESVQIDDETLQAEMLREKQEKQKQQQVMNIIKNDLEPINNPIQQINIKRVKQYSITESNDDSEDTQKTEQIYTKNNFFMSDPDVIEKPTKLSDVKNDITYYKRANVSADSQEEIVNPLQNFGDKYKNPIKKARNNSIKKRFSQGNSVDNENSWEHLPSRNSIIQRQRAQAPIKYNLNINNMNKAPQKVSITKITRVDENDRPIINIKPQKATITNITRVDQKDATSPTNLTFKPYLGFQSKQIQAQQQFYQKYQQQQKQQQKVDRDSFDDKYSNPEVADELNKTPIKLINLAYKTKPPKEIVINMNDIIDDENIQATRNFIRQKVQQIQNNVDNERYFRSNRFKNVSKNKENIYQAISKKIKEKYQSIRRDFVNNNSIYMKPLINGNQILKKNQKQFEPTSMYYYNIEIENEQFYLRQHHTIQQKIKLNEFQCQPFLEHQAKFIQNIQQYKLDKIQIQWINESKVFQRNIQWTQEKNFSKATWEESTKFTESELILKAKLSTDKQKCVYKLHKKYVEILFIKDYINATKHIIYHENTILHYQVRNFHTNTIVQTCQEQIIGIQKLPVINAYQTDEFGITQESKYNLYYSNGNYKTFITENIDNNEFNITNSICVIDKTYFKYKSRIALRSFLIPKNQAFQFVEIYFYQKEIATFEVYYNGQPKYKTVYNDFSEKLQNADQDTLFFMVNTFVNQNIVSQTNLVKKGYRIRLPYLRLNKNDPKRKVKVQVNTSKNNYFAFIYLQPQKQNLQVIRTAMFLTSNQQLNYLLVNDHNQSTIKVQIDKEQDQNEILRTRQINNEFFYFTNELIVNSTRFTGQKTIHLHQNAMRLQEGFFMETYFIQSLPENNKIVLKDAKINVQGSKISIRQNLYTLNLI